MPDLDSDHRSKMATYRIPPRTCLRKTPVRCVSEEGSYDDVGLMHLATRKGVFVWFQVSKLRVRRRERVQLRQLSDVKIRCFQRVSWCGKLANSTWTWRQWIYKVVWPHFFILMMCQICRTSRIRWRKGNVIAGLRSLLVIPLNTRCIVCHTCAEQDSKGRKRGHIAIPGILPFIFMHLW